ncbi:MAG: hypothetical protein IJ991_06845 [Thermoguttaceae bacterium]|nr:hypothetical protein [Thermoguttaceae bacterium]MBR2003882.1 hypothetical protein [Thermoguttaceae bacterium]MBR4834897.1 hypothetical protein [Thermoguttaceae bacterium]
MPKNATMDAALKKEIKRIQRKFIREHVLGRKPLPEGEARDERTTIRWKPDEIALVRQVAGDAPLTETIRSLALEAANARLNAR